MELRSACLALAPGTLLLYFATPAYSHHSNVGFEANKVVTATWRGQRDVSRTRRIAGLADALSLTERFHAQVFLRVSAQIPQLPFDLPQRTVQRLVKLGVLQQTA